MYLSIWTSELQRKRKRDLIFPGSLPRWPPRLVPGEDEASGQELLLGVFRCQDPKYLACLPLFFPGAHARGWIRSGTARKRTSVHVGCSWHCRCWLYLVCHNPGLLVPIFLAFQADMQIVTCECPNLALLTAKYIKVKNFKESPLTTRG